MFYRTDIGGTRPLVQVDAPTYVTPVSDARQESFERFAHIQLGKQTLAQIISRFDDGSFLVNVSNAAARMNLPEGAKVGDSLPLTLITRDPRPTFLLGPQSSGATATLSHAARLISNLLQTAQKEGGPTGLVGKTALLPSPANMQPAPLATTLQDTLEYSGLFYESHVVQWAQGGRSRAELMREPQARFSREFQPALPAALLKGAAELIPAAMAREVAALTGKDISAVLIKDIVALTGKDVSAITARDIAALVTKGLVAPTGHLGESGHLQIDPQTGVLLKVVPSIGQETAQKELPALSMEAKHIITQQLNTLDNNRVFWQGELWPGQPFEWAVSDETPQGRTEDTEKVWRSTLRLSMPTMGEIHASVQLSGDKVQLSLRADSQEVASVLQSHGDELAAALLASGTRLDFMGVGLNGQA